MAVARLARLEHARLVDSFLHKDGEFFVTRISIRFALALAFLLFLPLGLTGCQSERGYTDGVGIRSPFSSSGRPVYSGRDDSRVGLGAKDKDYVHPWP